MKVDYFNTEFVDGAARVTFIGRDSKGRSRRPVVELDATDLSQLIATANDFARAEQRLAEMHSSRANTILTSLKEATA